MSDTIPAKLLKSDKQKTHFEMVRLRFVLANLFISVLPVQFLSADVLFRGLNGSEIKQWFNRLLCGLIDKAEYANLCLRKQNGAQDNSCTINSLIGLYQAVYGDHSPPVMIMFLTKQSVLKKTER